MQLTVTTVRYPVIGVEAEVVSLKAASTTQPTTFNACAAQCVREVIQSPTSSAAILEPVVKVAGCQRYSWLRDCF